MAKIYNTVPDKTAGDLFTEAMWDDYIKTNGNNLITPAGVAVRRSTGQTGSAVTDTANVASFDTEDADTDAMWAIGSPTGIFINTTGLWIVSFRGSFTNTRNVEIWQAGNVAASSPMTISGTSLPNSVSAVLAITAGADLAGVWITGTGTAAVMTGGAFAAVWAGKLS